MPACSDWTRRCTSCCENRPVINAAVRIRLLMTGAKSTSPFTSMAKALFRFAPVRSEKNSPPLSANSTPMAGRPDASLSS